jgi:transposase
MRKNRTSYTIQEKVIILRKHLLEKIPISDICEQYELGPTVFYRWQKLILVIIESGGVLAFNRVGVFYLIQYLMFCRLGQVVDSWLLLY